MNTFIRSVIHARREVYLTSDKRCESVKQLEGMGVLKSRVCKKAHIITNKKSADAEIGDRFTTTDKGRGLDAGCLPAPV